jgi:glycosyltransferase involved in cell wall biosynthesis
MKKSQTLTIIIPFFNESASISIFIEQLKPILLNIQKSVKCKILFVNNGSTDGSLDIVKKQIQFKSFSSIPIGVLTLSRNFGYETALIAGLTHASSDYYCFCDSDGEDPVEIIPLFLESIKSGYAIAIGIRKGRFEPTSIKIFRRIAYNFLSKVSDDPFLRNAGNFAMFNEVVRSAILSENGHFPFIRATFSRCGFPIHEIVHDRNKRIAGQSKFRNLSLLKFALAGFLTTTTWPLRLVAYLSICSAAAILVWQSVLPKKLNLEVFLYIEFFLFSSVFSIYIARIYKNVINKPLFYVNWLESESRNRYSWKSSGINESN